MGRWPENAAGDDSYKQARFVMVWYTIDVFVMCHILDIVDTVLYYKYDKKYIDRSAWITRQLIQIGEPAPDHLDNV